MNLKPGTVNPYSSPRKRYYHFCSRLRKTDWLLGQAWVPGMKAILESKWRQTAFILEHTETHYRPWEKPVNHGITGHIIRGHHRFISRDRTGKIKGTTGTDCWGGRLKTVLENGSPWHPRHHSRTGQAPQTLITGTRRHCGRRLTRAVCARVYWWDRRHRQRPGEMRSRRVQSQARATVLSCLWNPGIKSSPHSWCDSTVLCRQGGEERLGFTAPPPSLASSSEESTRHPGVLLQERTWVIQMWLPGTWKVMTRKNQTGWYVQKGAGNTNTQDELDMPE